MNIAYIMRWDTDVNLEPLHYIQWDTFFTFSMNDRKDKEDKAESIFDALRLSCAQRPSTIKKNSSLN